MHIFPNGKKYIGQTSLVPKRRWGIGGGGYFTSREGKYWQPLMAYAINKYGWENIKHVTLAKVFDLDESNCLEEFYISLYNTCDTSSGYNIEFGGNNYKRRCNRVCSKETRLKMSLAKKGKPIPHLHNKEVYEKISKSMKGKKQSEETRKKHSASIKGKSPWNKGKKATEEAKRHQSEAHRGKFWWNNGTVSVQLKECPEGYIRGRLSPLKGKKNVSNI